MAANAGTEGLSIGLLKSEETYPIRSRVLREGKSFEHCQFEGDSEQGTFHFGIFVHGKLGGICTVLRNDPPLSEFPETAYQLRGMAVLPEFRSHGLGGWLLHSVEQYLKGKGVFYMWMNARQAAVGFYERHGYQKIGTMFEIQGIGPHYRMHKNSANESKDI